MKPWVTVGEAPGADGQKLVLQERDGVFVIRVGGLELMSSARHRSEEAMAEVALKNLPSPKPKVLIGGLGLGYTVRATLDRLPFKGQVVVAELSPAVIAWNRGPVKHLADGVLDDERVRLHEGDVGKLVSQGKETFDAVLLDADNGPQAMAAKSNEGLYSLTGLARLHQVLTPSGRLVVWSAGPDARFLKLLSEAGYQAREERVSARDGGRARHVLFVATRAKAGGWPSGRRGER